MTLSIIVETGLIVANANSYVTVANVNDYSALMGLTDSWDSATADDDEDAIGAILRACRSIEQHYGPRYLSAVLPYTNQALLWPRFPFYDNRGFIFLQGVIPQAIRDAQAQMAIDYLSADSPADGLAMLFPSPNTDSNLIQTDVKIGDVSESKRYSLSQRVSNFIMVDSIIWPVVVDDGPKSYLVSL